MARKIKTIRSRTLDGAIAKASTYMWEHGDDWQVAQPVEIHRLFPYFYIRLEKKDV